MTGIEMAISFDDSPNEPLFARLPKSEPSLDGVTAIVSVDVDGLACSTVLVRLVLEPEDARELAQTLQINANVVDLWRKNRAENQA
jgi:hypothetical protein